MPESAAPRAESATRVALLTPGPTLPIWAATAIEQMLAETDAEIALIVEDDSSDERTVIQALQRLVELREWGVVAAARTLLADRADQLERIPVASIDGVDDPERVACEPITVDGWKNGLPPEAVERLGETDVAVRFGFGFLVGDALTAPTHGVLSYHHGDFREYRGQPAGFWEYVHGRETAGVTLQRIDETLDGGEIVVERTVDVADAPTWAAVRGRLYDASTGMLAEGVRRLAAEHVEPKELSDDELGELYTHPRGRPVVTFLYKTARGTLVG